jgi:hypothetical protein
VPLKGNKHLIFVILAQQAIQHARNGLELNHIFTPTLWQVFCLFAYKML